MKPTKTIKLNFWLPILTLCLCASLWLFTLGLNYFQQKQHIIAENMRFARLDISLLIREMEREFNNGDFNEAESSLTTRALNTNYKSLIVTDDQGVILYSLTSSLKGKKATKVIEEFSQSLLKESLKIRKMTMYFNSSTNMIELYAPLSLARKNQTIRSLKAGVIFLNVDVNKQLDDVFRQALNNTSFFGFFLFVLLLLLMFFLNKNIRNPIHQLITITRQFTGNYKQLRANISGDGELATLASSFNHMADDLAEMIEKNQQAQREIKQSKQVLESVFEAIPDIYFLLDSHSKILDFRCAVESKLYQKPKEFLGKKMIDIMPANIAQQFKKGISKLLLGHNIVTFNYSLTVPEGRKHFEARLSQLKNSGKIVTIIRDITEHQEAVDQISYQANYDALTGLPNRFLLHDRLTQALINSKRSSQKIALLFIDLDDFKTINDSLGHEIGDQLLIQTAERLQNLVRAKDTVSRLGGDEFIILIEDINSEDDVTNIVKKILIKFKASFAINKRELTIGTSIGIAIYPENGTSNSELIRNADSAMYHAKESGRNTFSYYTEEMNKQATRRLLIEEQLRTALTNNELHVFYQPQFDFKTRKVIGAEALLRWHNPTLGNVSPEEFIPIAEQTGLIIDIGKYVLKEALKQSSQWRKTFNTKFRIAVNLSPRQFKNADLMDFICETMDATDTPPEQLELEITEGVLLSGYSAIKESLERIHQLGIFLSMDDFGTGYSSLSYLREYEFDVIKIDQSFVMNMSQSGKEFNLIKATINMSHGLGIKVVAEGVETEQQFLLLKELDCDIAQGYLLAKPISKQDMTKFLEDQHSVIA